MKNSRVQQQQEEQIKPLIIAYTNEAAYNLDLRLNLPYIWSEIVGGEKK